MPLPTAVNGAGNQQPGTGVFQSPTILWSNAAIKANQFQLLVAAPGPGFSLFPLQAMVEFIYGGTNIWSSNPTTFIQWNNSTTALTVAGSVGLWGQTHNVISSTGLSSTVDTQQDTIIENQPLTVKLSSPPTGNAAGDNTIKVSIVYTIVAI